MKRFGISIIGALLAACGSIGGSDPDVVPVEFTEVDEACVDFYRSAQESVEEEPVYMRAFADRIADLGHDAPAAVLSDLADQWEVGVWEPGEDEVWQSAQWAQAGELLAAAGAVRCADLAEWWGIDGYEGELDPQVMLERQASIWASIDVDSYFLLVAGGAEGEDLTQIHVQVQAGEVSSVSEIESGSADVDGLPHSVDEVYSILMEEETIGITYDLVWSVPRTVQLSNGDRLIVVIDIEKFPEPIPTFGEEMG